jgi:SAM-dependent methyltransferase
VSEPRFDPGRLVHPRDETPWWGVNAARYVFAAPYAAGKRVLDIACGTGYGLALLEGRAARVTGVDMDVEALRKAPAAIADGSTTVVAADACWLPFDDASFDLVVSFETLEHLRDRETFVGELRRVLTAEGTCILSTPNANYTQPVNGKPTNPFHVHEYAPDELRDALGRHFPRVELLGQLLDSRFRISPFWEDQQRLPRALGVQARRFLWRVLNKAGVRVRNPASRWLWGHAFYPGEHDYRFSAATVHVAPVLVAICDREAA